MLIAAKGLTQNESECFAAIRPTSFATLSSDHRFARFRPRNPVPPGSLRSVIAAGHKNVYDLK